MVKWSYENQERYEEEKMSLTTLCYIEKDDAYLMMHRIKKKNDVNEGKWIGVGGHFEENESPELLINSLQDIKRGVSLEKKHQVPFPDSKRILHLKEESKESKQEKLMRRTLRLPLLR